MASDVDLMSTYVAGSVECVASVLADEQLESYPVTVDQSVYWNSDAINPTPEVPAEITVKPKRRRRLRLPGDSGHAGGFIHITPVEK